jgi:hypothetical protein
MKRVVDGLNHDCLLRVKLLTRQARVDRPLQLLPFLPEPSHFLLGKILNLPAAFSSQKKSSATN